MERIEIYRRRSWKGKRQWYWRVKAANNRVTAIGGEGFNSMGDAAHIAFQVTGERLPIEYLD